MVAQDLADVLSTGGIGTVGTDVFYGVLPDTVATGVAVVETGGSFSLHTMGPGPATTFGAGVATVERPRVQVFSRSPTYTTARAKAQDAFNLLDGLRDRTVNGRRYLWIAAVQSPFDLGRDGNDRQQFAFNLDITKYVSSSSST
jgi:hypothetical protein